MTITNGTKLQDKVLQRLYELYCLMRRIRTFEERVGELFIRGESAGTMLHLSIGEESAAAGVGMAMQRGDSFTTHHRGHGIFLARGADPNRMMAEIAGKESGYCHGKGGSMHIADMSLGHLGANAIVGGGIPVVVGAGISYKLKKKPQVSVAFFGDGALQQGVLYESMNMTALFDLPVLFVCINNQYAMGTRIDRATKSTEFDKRAVAFGLEARMVDGEDVEEVYDTASGLLKLARQGQPGFLCVSCYRFFGHARKDKSPYRSEEEEAKGRQRDPVQHATEKLLQQGFLTEKELAAIDHEIAKEMDASLEFAINSPLPETASMFSHVYADDQPQPVPIQQRFEAIFRKRISKK